MFLGLLLGRRVLWGGVGAVWVGVTGGRPRASEAAKMHRTAGSRAGAFRVVLVWARAGGRWDQGLEGI